LFLSYLTADETNLLEIFHRLSLDVQCICVFRVEICHISADVVDCCRAEFVLVSKPNGIG